MEFRKTINANLQKEDKISVFSFILKAYSLAIQDYPKINSLYSPDKPYECEIHSSHNISIAIDTLNGLIAPNIKDVQNKSILEVQRSIIDLRDKADKVQVGGQDLFGGTSALSNIGTIGGTYASPLNLPNQVCIVALGKVKESPSFVQRVNPYGGNLDAIQMKKTVRIIF